MVSKIRLQLRGVDFGHNFTVAPIAELVYHNAIITANGVQPHNRSLVKLGSRGCALKCPKHRLYGYHRGFHIRVRMRGLNVDGDMAPGPERVKAQGWFVWIGLMRDDGLFGSRG
jgi:hypothetical protein